MTIKKLAYATAHSAIMSRGARLWRENKKDWNLPLSNLDKLFVGLHVILDHYAAGRFPPTFDDQSKAYEAEIAYDKSLPGVTEPEVFDIEMRKPFWQGKLGNKYLRDFVRLKQTLEKKGLLPGSKILELGCGAGWMAEMLSLQGYRVTGTTLAPQDVEKAKRRIDSISVKGLKPTLEFLISPMENVNAGDDYDCIFVYEALHHAYDWRAALCSAYSCLRKGGWLIIANEPNEIHTLVAYRVAVLSNTHEIGFNVKEVKQYLKETGFKPIRVVRGSPGFKARPFWMVAQK